MAVSAYVLMSFKCKQHQHHDYRSFLKQACKLQDEELNNTAHEENDVNEFRQKQS